MFSLTWPTSMQIYWTKESVCIRKKFNSHRICLGHQHGRRFIVLGHQYGRRDVMWKHSIRFWQTPPYPSPNPRLTLTLRKMFGSRRGRWVKKNKMNYYMILANCLPTPSLIQQSPFSHRPIMHLVYPPKFCKTIVSNFSWVLQLSQEKSKTMVCKILGGKQSALWCMWKWWINTSFSFW